MGVRGVFRVRGWWGEIGGGLVVWGVSEDRGMVDLGSCRGL